MQTLQTPHDEYKIFVGNIPFDSTDRELSECFCKYKDFVSADIIKGRGFGFVVFSSENERDKIININNFYIKNRKLRLHSYDNINKLSDKSLFIRIENIDTNISRDDIYKEISIFCKVKKCFIDTNRLTGEKLSTGLLEISDFDIYNKLINLESLLMPNNTYINLKSYPNTNYIVNSPKYKVSSFVKFN
jgi:RNA recognition motif-containing protein